MASSNSSLGSKSCACAYIAFLAGIFSWYADGVLIYKNLFQAAKMAKYANYQKVCDALFVIFTLLWITTRLGVYPMWIIYSTSIEAPKIVEMFPAYYIFNFLLVLLLVLHLFWTYVILKIAYKSLVAGQMEGDIRSSSSDEVSDESGNHPSSSLASQNSLHLCNNSKSD